MTVFSRRTESITGKGSDPLPVQECSLVSHQMIATNEKF